MAITTKVLLIDDDVSLAGMMRPALEAAGYSVEIGSDGLEGLLLLYQSSPDLVILDVMMPRVDGWETCRRIREVSDVPILMLTARQEESCELKGLRSGADLYVTKPFAVPLLLARVEALLRRSRTSAKSNGGALNVGDIRIDLARYEVTRAGQPVDLTPTEFRLLTAIASRPGQVVPHRELLMQVWGPEYVDEDLYLKLYIRRLRQKLEEDPSRPQYILTRRGIGYYLHP